MTFYFTLTFIKNTLTIICFIILFSNLSYSQTSKSERHNLKYFDENYKPISQSEFEKRKSNHDLLIIQGDSANHKKLVVREKHGTIEGKKNLDSLLTSATNKKIDSSKPIVIIYYPGEDVCNSSSSTTRETIKNWYDDMEKRINKIKTSTILYIYKNADGLYGRNDGFKDWIKDPENIIEKLFFYNHYPCHSFVVISEKNHYISYFGEFPKEYVWKATKALAKH